MFAGLGNENLKPGAGHEHKSLKARKAIRASMSQSLDSSRSLCLMTSYLQSINFFMSETSRIIPSGNNTHMMSDNFDAAFLAIKNKPAKKNKFVAKQTRHPTQKN
jgi:hypothetical protein